MEFYCYIRIFSETSKIHGIYPFRVKFLCGKTSQICVIYRKQRFQISLLGTCKEFGLKLCGRLPRESAYVNTI